MKALIETLLEMESSDSPFTTQWQIQVTCCSTYAREGGRLGVGGSDKLIYRLLGRWESRSPMDGHFSERINMNYCKQRFILANLEIFRYLCTHNCRKTPCILLRPSNGDKVRPYKIFGLPLFKSWLKACLYSLVVLLLHFSQRLFASK